jgi:hypothetical protein
MVRTVFMFFEDFAHDLFSFSIGNLAGLLEEEICLVFIDDVEFRGERVTNIGAKELQGQPTSMT